jgi:predicted PurR-regulated permease PerM
MTGDRGLRAAVVLIAVVAVFGAVHLARSVFMPIAFALFIIAIVWPLQRRLQSRLPKLLALAIVILVTAAVFVIFASLIAWSSGRVGRWLVSEAGRFQVFYEQLMVRLEGYGVTIARLWAEHFNVSWLVRAVQQITGRVNTTMSFWLIVLGYVVLGLLEVDVIGRKLQAMENREVGRALLAGSLATAAKFRSYMLVRTLMSLMTGVFVWAFAALMGLQFAAEWGVIVFALNYILYIGAFIATLLPTLFALAQFVSWQAALAVFAGLTVIQFAIGYIEPRASGSMLAVSPLVVLFAVFLWALLWGLAGAFIGVPITIAVLIFCAQHPACRWLPDLLGAPAKETEASYQRLV